MPGCRSRLVLWLCITACGLVFTRPANAGEFLDPDHDDQQWALRGLEALHNSDFALASVHLDKYHDLAPDDPLAPLLLLKLAWWRIVEGCDRQGDIDEEFKKRFEQVHKLAREHLKQNPDDVRALYALGEAYCCYGRLEGIRGHGWSTFNKHKKGTPLLERALSLQPDLSAPLSSLGVFHYYASQAPGFLRFVARFFHVKADRSLGLQELFTAARVPGIGQAEAAFFLIRILNQAEDDQLNALPIALRFHQKYPQGLGFALHLAMVQVEMERPDAAIRVLEKAEREGSDHVAIAARFFLARAYSITGRASEAIERLTKFDEEDFAKIEWLRAWRSYYMGYSYEQLGRVKEARQLYKKTTEVPSVADSHGLAKRALDRKSGTLYALALSTESRLSWDAQMDVDVQPVLEALEEDHFADTQTRTEAQYAAGSFLLRSGYYSHAARLLRKCVRYGKSEDAWLVVRPRIRLLQALLWAGRIEEAKALAVTLQEHVGEWGSNRQLELLIQSCLQLSTTRIRFEEEPPLRFGDRPTLFRLKDIGFSQVRIAFATSRGSKSYAMEIEAGYWQVVVPLPTGQHRYRFEVEDGAPLPDPVQDKVRESSDGLWSLVTVEPRAEI